MAKTPSRSLPASDNPGTVAELRDPHGKLIQKRFYGADGRALKNVDYGYDHGAGIPHVHDWDWTQLPPRGIGRPPKAGEPI
jgi:hypothetical protein